MAGAIDQAVANTVGNGLRLKAMPENELFGMSNDQAEEWAQARRAALEPLGGPALRMRHRRTPDLRADAGRSLPLLVCHRRNLGGASVAGTRGWPLRHQGADRPAASRDIAVTTSLRNVVQGVRMNGDGMPVAYLATRKDLLRGTTEEYEVQARDAQGRTRVDPCL